MKEFKIGIIGTENYHAHEFTTFFNIPDENGNLRYPDCHVNLVYGHYPEASELRVKEDGADKVAESIEEMVENVDAVMITARDGKFHYEFAKKFIEAGKPVFMDKPFTVSIDDAVSVIKLAKEHNVPICGGSALKYSKEIVELKELAASVKGDVRSGNVSAPLQYQSEYSGFYFYASHLTEMTLEIFGKNPKSVLACERGNSVSAIISYDDFSVTNNYNDASETYHASIYFNKGGVHKEVTLDECFKKECDVFVEMLRSGKMPCTYEDLFMPVLYMNAVMESVKTGKEVKIEEIRL